jgi:hypothetical protein
MVQKSVSLGNLRFSILELSLIASCAALAVCFGASLYLSSRHAAHEQALLAEGGEIHAQAVTIAQRLHLVPAGTTQLLLRNIGKQIGPRFLSAADSETIANILIPAGVMNFQVDTISNDPETQAFARQMFNTLLLAGWTPTGPGPQANYTNNVADVSISAATKKQFPAVYAELMNAFAAAGVAVTPDTTGKSFAPPGVVEIMVGAKP